MPVTVTTTVGAANANSYLSVAEGDAYAALDLRTLNWSTATTDNKGKAVINATAYLDQLEWVGTKASTTQALLWPRDDASCGEKAYDNDELPLELKRATFELAEALLDSPTILAGSNPAVGELIPGIPNANLKAARVDVISVDFRDGGGAPVYANALTVVPALKGILGCLCLSSPASSVGTVKVQRS
jgi:hypothetical protein